MKPNTIVVDRLTTDSKLFAHTRWDAVPVAAGLLHCAYFFGMFYLFPRAPLWVMLILGFIYSVSISWNINGISHNFIHNPYFRAPLLNRLFSILESITVGFSQIFYECVHMQHHKGNADRPNDEGETVDWISIYKHGDEGDAEHPLKYTFMSFFREDPVAVFKELKRKDPREAFWGVLELTLFVATFVILGILNWRYICFLLPFYYLGHSLSYLNGYYRHFGGNPDEPLAWGVSSYDKLYNWTWFLMATTPSIISGRRSIGHECRRSAIRLWINSARRFCPEPTPPPAFFLLPPFLPPQTPSDPAGAEPPPVSAWFGALRFRGRDGGRDKAFGDVARAARGDHVERSRHAIHSRHGAVGADVHFVAHKWRRCALGQFAPMRAGEKRGHDHERAEHAATNSFHGSVIIVGPNTDAQEISSRSRNRDGNDRRCLQKRRI